MATARRAHNLGLVRLDGTLADHRLSLADCGNSPVSHRLPACPVHWWIYSADHCSGYSRNALAWRTRAHARTWFMAFADWVGERTCRDARARRSSVRSNELL